MNSTVVGTRGMEDEKHIIQSLFPVFWKESSTLDSAGEYKTALVLKPERERKEYNNREAISSATSLNSGVTDKEFRRDVKVESWWSISV